ncbi:ankyrin repeat domain-containing protein [Winogradskyella flava]|uniref:Ankyrin repeat domain-containing protein n=1 Tax=Winogradskyella flava TaxID=1884876 RepID=A0A842IUE9_9FLAO|nr:ankyrin repeat domain-containing protein [Winogradskyella flava]MBC2846405.1 ankyrin repeat domain-containing protein [Winogradskyella flava]
MRKSAVILALALGFSVCNLNATNDNLVLETNNVTVQTAEVNPLCKAIASGNTELVKTLIKQGADVNKKSNGMQPIHYAAKYNRVELIKVLITAGSEIHTPCDKGYSALRHAEKSNAVDAAQFLKRFKKRNV